MGTYFLIFVQPDKGPVLELGPYLTLKEASEIFAGHIEYILLAQGIQTEQYVAKLIEAYPTSMGWATLSIKVEATQTYNLKDVYDT